MSYYNYNNKSTEAFFLLVRAGLFGRTEHAEILLSDGVDWTEVCQLATEQSVIGLVAEGIETLQNEWFKTHNAPLVPQKWVLQLVGTALKLESKNVAMNKFIASLVGRLRKRGVHAILLKGQGVAQNYEKPYWRACGDVDLLLDDEGYLKAKEFLLQYAPYVDVEIEYKKHLGMKINDWLVELHGSLRCGFSSRIDKELDKMCDETFRSSNLRTWMNGKVQIPLLEKENDVLYVFTHFLNHFFKGGVGIKQISDWCRLLWTFRDSLDIGRLESRIEAMGLTSEWRAFGMYAVEYLGMPESAMPFYADDDKWRRKAKRINMFIVRKGREGYHRMKKAKKVTFLTRKINSSMQRFRNLLFISRIFPLNSIRFFPSILHNGLRQK